MRREIKFRAWIPSSKTMFYFPGPMVDLHTPHLMQFTGLRDRHGKPIYEGDIVDTMAEPFDAPCRIQTVVADPDCPGSLCFEPGTGAMLHKQNERIFEILGNIYEHPDLLKASP